MKTDLSHLIAYLNATEYQLEKKPAVGSARPVITISRQRGAHGTLIAQMLAEYLTQKSHDDQPWVVIDKNLTEHVIEDHHLSKQICGFLTEEQEASARDRVKKVLGLKVPHVTTLEKMTHTMMRLAEIGHVIFVGRAANIVTAHLPQAYHVRVIASIEFRVRQVMDSMKLSRGDAESLVRKTDYNRAHFVSSYFRTNPADPTRYHLTINTELVPVEKAVLLIAGLISPSEAHLESAGESNRLQVRVAA